MRSGCRCGHGSSRCRRSASFSPKPGVLAGAARPACGPLLRRRPNPGRRRGVESFTRYGLHRRNGLAFAAVPLDHIKVRETSEVRLLAGVEDWLVRLAPVICPGRWGAARRFEAAHLEVRARRRGVRWPGCWPRSPALEQAVGRSGRVRKDGACAVRPLPRRNLPAGPGRAGSCPARAAGSGRDGLLRHPPGADPAREPSRTMRRILLPWVRPPGRAAGPDGGRWRDTPCVAGFGLRPLGRGSCGRAGLAVGTAAAEPGSKAAVPRGADLSPGRPGAGGRSACPGRGRHSTNKRSICGCGHAWRWTGGTSINWQWPVRNRAFRWRRSACSSRSPRPGARRGEGLPHRTAKNAHRAMPAVNPRA